MDLRGREKSFSGVLEKEMKEHGNQGQSDASSWPTEGTLGRRLHPELTIDCAFHYSLNP